MNFSSSSGVLPLGSKIMARIDELAHFSSDLGKLTRLYLSPEHKAAAFKVKDWMEHAGMIACIDAIGNVVGRYEGVSPGLPALIIGSHIDSVPNAGKYDGILGVVTAIACVEALCAKGERLPFAIEVIAFGDEEGVRFPTSMAGSRAVAGILDFSCLSARDGDGVTLGDALQQFGLDPNGLASLARHPEQVLGYVELHIEQGPVLDTEKCPVGIVTSIAGASRFSVEIEGLAGHAGTVPMRLRRDALAAAAEAILAIEQRCAGDASRDLVGTVGQIVVLSGAANVIPDAVRFSVDVRAASDVVRRAASDDIALVVEKIAERRGVSVRIVEAREVPACACASELMEQLAVAVKAEMGGECVHLPSGAMHDAMQLAKLTDAAMLFVRCKDGISHNPLESVRVEDADLGARILLAFIRNFTPRE